MSLLKSIFAGIISIFLVLFLYSAVVIPVLPCISIYCATFLFLRGCKGGYRTRRFFVWATGLLALYLYTFQINGAIKFYPEYGNWLAILGDVTTWFSIVGAMFTVMPALNAEVAQYKAERNAKKP